MKAISLWQPWASLLACGEKKFETRSWATSYRGPIAIHAAEKEPRAIFYSLPLNVQCTMSPILLEFYTFWDKVPRGAVIATADLADCYRMGIDPKTHRIALYNSCGYQTSISIMSQEILFGNWEPGRYAWEFANMKMLDNPIPAKGGQRIWNWEESQP
jgi:hypothetical protein